MKRLIIIFFILISSSMDMMSQNYPYFKFDKDTSLTNNKDCSCFTNMRHELDVENIFDKKTNTGFIFKNIDLNKFKGMKIGEVIDSLSKSFTILDTTLINETFYAYDSLDKHLYEYNKTNAIILPLYLDSANYIELTIDLNYSLNITTLQNEYNRLHVIDEIKNIDRYCMYSYLNNFDLMLISFEKFSSISKNNKAFLKESERIQKLKQKAKEIYKLEKNE